MGDHVKGRSPIVLKSITEVPNLVDVKAHVLSLNMILVRSHLRVLTPSYPFGRKFRRYGKGSFSEKLKILIEVP